MIVTVTDLYDGVTPETSPVTITVIEGSATSGGGGGAVDSVNGHVGVVVLDADDLADGTTNHVFTAADDTKLAGIATGATANDTDANLKARANHTGTQAIATVAGLQTALDGKDTALAAHEADTTNVHGITDTSALVLTGDARLADARTPTAHATSHQDGGSDEVALDGSQITTGTVADVRIASTIARDTEVSAAVSTHEGLSDPHPGYLTSTEGDAAYQPKDADLTTIAALDSTTAGALTTDGSGWIRKTYAQLKTALSLVKADVGLGSVDNTADTAKPVSTAQQTALDLKVSKSLFDANTILAATTDDTPAALTVAASRIVGRKATGDIAALTGAEVGVIVGSLPSIKARDRKYRTTDLSVTSNSKTTVMDSSLDCTLAGAAGDVVQFTFRTYIDSNTNVAHFNVWTLPPAGGALINKCVDEGSTFNPFYCETAYKGLFTFTEDYVLQAGDITSGQFRLTITVHTANAARTLSLGVIGCNFTVKNLGPVA